MKIFFYRYGSICEPDVIDGLQELGHTIIEYWTPKSDSTHLGGQSQDNIRKLSECLFQLSPDCIFSINFFPILSKIGNIFKLRYISWSVDCPVMEYFSDTITSPWNRIFLFDREQYNDISPLNPDCVFYLPLAGNPKKFQTTIQKASSATLHKYAAPISFIGSLYSEKNPYDKVTGLPDIYKGFLDGIIQAQSKIYGYYFIEELLTDEIINVFKEHHPCFYSAPESSALTDKIICSQLYIGNKITALERQETFFQLSEHFPTTIYTGSDTRSLPHIQNKGFANSETEMPLIFHESSININTTSKIIRSGIPQRIWDILACEGFLLSNYQNEIPELLTINSDLVAYGSIDELLDKCAYYLEHSGERKEIAKTGFETLCKYHTYPQRLEQLLTIAFHA